MSQTKNTILAHLKGVKAVILFPALTTPGLVKGKGPMDVIVAVHKDHIDGNPDKDIEKTLKKYGKGAELDAHDARKLHSHLAMVPWGNNTFHKLQNDMHYASHMLDLRRQCFMVYHDHQEASGHAEARKIYKCWAIEELTKPKDLLIYIYDKDDKKVPFGILHKAAVHMYLETGYKYLFQIHFKEISDPEGRRGLNELVWLYYDHDELKKYGPKLSDVDREHLFFKPSDIMAEQVMEEGFGLTSLKQQIAAFFRYKPLGPLNLPVVPPLNPKLKDGFLLLKNKDTKEAKIIQNGKSVLIDQYRLQRSGKRMLNRHYQSTPQTYNKSGMVKDNLPYMTQKQANFFHYRHPVYVSPKDTLPIGMIADAHISSRQTVYRFVKAQVIPGANKTNSAYIGPTAHDNIQSTMELMDAVGGANDVDILAIPGDLYDHTINLNPAACIHDITKTGKLWGYMDYEKHSSDRQLYPFRIDGLMFLNLVLNFYNNKKKPVFFVSGNHEAYNVPYGVSPRALTKEWFMVNPGIPADHNLTPYEAILLYGPTYHQYYDPNDFKDWHMNWLYAAFTPWKDCVIRHGDSQAHVLLGWGNEEIKIRTILSGGTLPRAQESLTDDQLTLVKHVAELSGKTVMVSHFPVANFAEGIPYGQHDWSTWNTPSKEQFSGESGLLSTLGYTPWNLGSFTQSKKAVYGLLANKKIKFSLSGHAHRAGVYEFSGMVNGKLVCTPRAKQADQGLGTIWFSPAGSYGFVCGSTGPYSKQNIFGELGGMGNEKPQGMIVDFNKGAASIVRSGGSNKPRMAVVAEYLHIDGVSLIEKIYYQKNSGKITLSSGRTQEKEVVCIKCHRKWFDFFKGNPIKQVSIHFVSFAPGREEPDPTPIILTPLSYDLEKLIIYMSPNSSDILNDLDDKEDDMGDSGRLFLSIDFAAEGVYELQYDLTGYCIPARLEPIEEGFVVFRGWTVDRGIGNTVPDLMVYANLEEYDDK